jgi:hypothetical protein
MRKVFLVLAIIFSVTANSQCDSIPSANITFSTIGTTSITTNWTAATGAISYILEVENDVTGSLISTTIGAGNLFYTTNGLQQNTLYNVKVLTVCSGGIINQQINSVLVRTRSTPVIYTPMTANGYSYKRGSFDSTLHVPFVNDTSLYRGLLRPGAIICYSADSLFYGWNGKYFALMGADVASLVNRIDSKVDSVTVSADTLYYWVNGVSYGDVLSNISEFVPYIGATGHVDIRPYKISAQNGIFEGPINYTSNINGSLNGNKLVTASYVDSIFAAGGTVDSLTYATWKRLYKTVDSMKVVNNSTFVTLGTNQIISGIKEFQQPILTSAINTDYIFPFQLSQITLGSDIFVQGGIAKQGGTSSQFLKADGSVDAASYLPISSANSTFQRLDNLQTDLTPSATKYASVNAVNTGLGLKLNTGDTTDLLRKTSNALLTLNAPSLATTQDLTKGILLQNSTAATVGTPVQITPSLRFKSNGWLEATIGGGVGNNNAEWIMYQRPVSGNIANYDNDLVFAQRVGSNAFSEVGRFTKNGYSGNIAVNNLTLGSIGNNGSLSVARDSDGGIMGSLSAGSSSMNLQSSVLLLEGSSYVGFSTNPNYGMRYASNSGLYVTNNSNFSATPNSMLVVNDGGASIGQNVAAPTNGLRVLGNAIFDANVTAANIIRSGGTATQILAANGSVITAGTNITISGGVISSTGGGGGVTSVTGTTNRITSSGGATPAIDISATFEALLGKVASPLSQFAATTSSQLAGVISDETGSGNLVFNNSPNLLTPTIGAATTGVRQSIINVDNLANFAQAGFYPSTGTNIGSALQIIPKGTGSYGIRSQLTFANTDIIADATNIEVLVQRAAATSYTFNSIATGTGTLRPIEFQMNNTSYFNIGITGIITIPTSITTPAINGGTAANDDITIQGTTNATRTTSYVNLQPNGGFVGIGTTTPVVDVDLVGNSVDLVGMKVTNNGTTGANPNFAMYQGGSNAFGITAWQNSAIFEAQSSGGLAFGAFAGDIKFYATSARTPQFVLKNSTGIVGIGTTTPNASAQLDVTSTTRGFLPPRMTTTQRDAIVSPAAGLVVYNTTTNKHQGYNGSTWNDFY